MIVQKCFLYCFNYFCTIKMQTPWTNSLKWKEDWTDRQVLLSLYSFIQSTFPHTLQEYQHSSWLNDYFFLGPWKRRNVGTDKHKMLSENLQTIENTHFPGAHKILYTYQRLHGSQETVRVVERSSALHEISKKNKWKSSVQTTTLSTVKRLVNIVTQLLESEERGLSPSLRPPFFIFTIWFLT